MLSYVTTGDLYDRFGWSAAGLGDIDLDGCADWIVGSHDARPDRGGFADVYSGKTSRRLFRFEGPHGFGSSVGAAGDVDGDGRPDAVVAGDPDARHRVDGLLAIVYSGRDGAVLRRLPRSTHADLLIANPIGLADIDGDGCSELALLVRTSDEAPLQLRVHSGRNASILRTVEVPLPKPPDWVQLDRTRLSLAGADSRADSIYVLLAGATGEARLISAREGGTVLVHPPEGRPAWDVEFGAAVAGPGDLDGDGIPDLWVGRDVTGIAEGSVFAYSGRDGHVIYTLGHGGNNVMGLDPWHFGAAIVAVGDLDGDGVCDALIGADHSLSHQPGCAFVFSGRTGKQLFAFARNGTQVRVIR